MWKRTALLTSILSILSIGAMTGCAVRGTYYRGGGYYGGSYGTYYARPARRQVWVPGHYVYRGGGYYYQPGCWR